MDLLLNIDALQPIKISTEESSSFTNIDVWFGTYKISKENIDMYLKELLNNFHNNNSISLINLENF